MRIPKVYTFFYKQNFNEEVNLKNPNNLRIC